MSDDSRVRTDTGLADAIRAARIGLGLSQSAVAERVGVTTQTMCNWERGKHRMPVATMLELLDYYGYED